jgi:DNA-binding transcriptional ArsR family regulator
MSLQNEIKILFSHFGRSAIEAETYLAALALGSGTAAEIAQKTGEGRTKVYFHIKKLVEDGLLRESRRGQRQIFFALPPAEFAHKVGEWATGLRSLVPQLEMMQKASAETPVIEVSESRSGYFRVYSDISSMSRGSSFRVLQGKESLEKELRLLDHETWDMFFTKIVERNITTVGLFTKECWAVPRQMLSPENYERMKMRAWDLAVMPESVLRLQQLIFIYQNKVSFLFPETALVMTITHQGIADVLGASFDALHSFGERVEPTW